MVNVAGPDGARFIQVNMGIKIDIVECPGVN
jgi:hypothetical protein